MALHTFSICSTHSVFGVEGKIVLKKLMVGHKTFSVHVAKKHSLSQYHKLFLSMQCYDLNFLFRFTMNWINFLLNYGGIRNQMVGECIGLDGGELCKPK